MLLEGSGAGRCIPFPDCGPEGGRGSAEQVLLNNERIRV